MQRARKACSRRGRGGAGGGGAAEAPAPARPVKAPDAGPGEAGAPAPKRERLLSESGTWGGTVASLVGFRGRAAPAGERGSRSPGERPAGGPEAPGTGGSGGAGGGAPPPGAAEPEPAGAEAPTCSPQATRTPRFDGTPSPKLFLRNAWLSAKKKRPPSMQKGLIVGSLGRDVEMSPQERRLGFQLPPSPSDPRPTAADLRKAALLRSVLTPARPRAPAGREGRPSQEPGPAGAPSASPDGMQVSPCREAGSPQSMSLMSVEMKSSSDHSSGPAGSGLMAATCGTPCS